MSSLYSSTVINGAEGWGDSIPVFWILEDIGIIMNTKKFICGTGGDVEPAGII